MRHQGQLQSKLNLGPESCLTGTGTYVCTSVRCEFPAHVLPARKAYAFGALWIKLIFGKTAEVRRCHEEGVPFLVGKIEPSQIVRILFFNLISYPVNKLSKPKDPGR